MCCTALARIYPNVSWKKIKIKQIVFAPILLIQPYLGWILSRMVEN